MGLGGPADPITVPKTRRPSAEPVLPPPAPVNCPRCAHTCTVIRLAPGTAAAPLTLHSCHFCEHRWWTREDDTVSLSDVLTASTVEKRSA
jgi:hypothetical protein